MVKVQRHLEAKNGKLNRPFKCTYVKILVKKLYNLVVRLSRFFKLKLCHTIRNVAF